MKLKLKNIHLTLNILKKLITYWLHSYYFLGKKMTRIIIFGSDTLLKVLCEGELTTFDGTFDFAADLFFQVYILMSYFRKKMLPCVFSLMNKKIQIAYTWMLNEIRLAWIQGNFNSNSKKVMIYFEIRAIEATLPMIYAVIII